MQSRILIFLINIIFPPLSILLLTGAGRDTLFSLLLLIFGVIPSHLHAFYLAYIYFSRRRRIEKGQYPGSVPQRRCIFDRRVWNGGMSESVVEEIRVREEMRKTEKGRKGRREWGIQGEGGSRVTNNW